jgi:hypothetical protein
VTGHRSIGSASCPGLSGPADVVGPVGHTHGVTSRDRVGAAPQTAEPAGLCAFVDESMRLTAGDDGTYLLVAAVAEVGRCEELRQTVRSLLYKKQKRLHWRDEEGPRRTKIAETVGGLPMVATVVIGTPLARSKQERARRKCAEALLPHLEVMGVTRVVMEARTPSLVEVDRRMVAAIRGKRLITPELRVDTAKAQEEPLLWVPDAIAGAYGAARTLGRTDWLELVGAVHEIEVSTR